MAALKIIMKNSQAIVKGKLSSAEQLNEREVSVLSGKRIRGFMYPKIDNSKKLVYIAPACLPLGNYLKTGIGRDTFFFILAQVMDAVKKVEYNNLYLKNLTLDLKFVLIHPLTKELQFVYQPIISMETSTDVVSFLNDIVYTSVFQSGEETGYVTDVIEYLKNLKKFSASEVEQYIKTVQPSAYAQLTNQNAGQSGFVINEKPGNLQNEGTTLLDSSEGTTILNDSLSQETVVLEEQPAFPYLIRKKNEEKIFLNKPVFRIGKEKSYVDYFVSDNNAVSRSHADIIVRSGKFFVYDNNSTNKTYVKGVAIPVQKEIEIFDGDPIRLANEDFEFKVQ